MSANDAPPVAIESHPDGDAIHIDVRLVVAPLAGRFEPPDAAAAPVAGGPILPGALIGHVRHGGVHEAVRSFCGGTLVEVLAEPDDQVRAGQPLAWIRPVGP